MSYFKPVIDATGIHVPDYVTIRDYLIDEFRRIFGQDLYLGTDTQDYQMISLFATAMDDVLALTVEAYNNRNPDFARGNALDLLLPMNGITRLAATNSNVTLKVTSDVGVDLAAGNIATDQKGNRWILQSDVSIPENGASTVYAIAEKAGRITAGIGSITGIGTPTAGWVSVTNEAEPIPGRDTETDAEVRSRRLASVENVAIGVVPSLVGSMYELDGVEKVRVYENNTSDYNDLGIPQHSICTVVDGGNETEIAKLIYNKKSPGCGLFGNTTKEIINDHGEAVNINFSRPSASPVSVVIDITKFIGYSQTIEDNIKAAVAEHISGHDIGQTLEIGLLWGIVLGQNPANSPIAYSPSSVKMGFGTDVPGILALTPNYDGRVSCIVSHITINAT